MRLERRVEVWGHRCRRCPQVLLDLFPNRSMSNYDIALKTGYKLSYVRRWRQAAYDKYFPTRIRWRDPDVREHVRQLRIGRSWPQVAKELQVDYSYLKRAVRTGLIPDYPQ